LDKNSNLPDGLNHALSQENIRLQQLVLEFKVMKFHLIVDLNVNFQHFTDEGRSTSE
jgi:hypothetical protein